MDQLISVATIINKRKEDLELYLSEISLILSTNYKNYEIILINNNTIPQFEISKIKSIVKKYFHIRLINLTRSYDLENVKMAMLDQSLGEYLILMDLNTDPPNLVPEMVDKIEQGYDLVIGEKKNRKNEPIIERFLSWIFFTISKKITGYPINPNYSNFICMSRKMVNYIVKNRNKSRYLRFLILEIGFNFTSIKFNEINRSNTKNKMNFINKLGFSFEILLTNSHDLLRYTSIVGLLISFLNLFYIIYIFLVILFKTTVVEGWISINLVFSTMFFFMFLLLSIMGIYISSILKETKKGQFYHILEEYNSISNFKKFEKMDNVLKR